MESALATKELNVHDECDHNRDEAHKDEHWAVKKGKGEQLTRTSVEEGKSRRGRIVKRGGKRS